jgi:8-oxo-dGTP pyrophosphatase MutT (NUDIX family)
MLGTFGGHTEGNETPEETVRRELSEETSLQVATLQLGQLFSVEVVVGANKDEMRNFVFEARIESMDFEVFEGKGAEAYSLEELSKRNDISVVVIEILKKLKENKEFSS